MSDIFYLREFNGDKKYKGKINIMEACDTLQRAVCYAPKDTPAAVLGHFSHLKFKETQPNNSVILEYDWTTDGVEDIVEFYLPY